jgi:hypothetical protein
MARPSLFASPRRLVLTALALVTTAPAMATVVTTEAIEQLAKQAPIVVRATVKTSISQWTANKRLIVTRTELQVDEILKGKVPTPFFVQQPGGTVDGVTAAVSGTAQFSPQESVVLFLEPLPNATDKNTFVVLSMTAGKVQLNAGPNKALATQKQMSAPVATRDLTGLSVYDASVNSHIRKAESTESLGDAAAFVARLKKLLKGAP